MDALKQGQNGRHSERPVYATATPLLENLCESSFGVRGSQQVEETAADSLVLPHFTLSPFLSLSVIAAALHRVYLITVYPMSCLIALLHPPCN